VGENCPPTGKMQAFVTEVTRLGGVSAVAYTEFFATHDRLRKLLTNEGVRVVPFTGRMVPAEKQARLEGFRARGGVLLCTEVGGQGLNLQHCSTVFNYDIPWNPMRLEQRIGRVHRLGQRHPIDIVNFVTKDTYEVRVYELLARKLELFTQAVGELEAVLSFIEEEESVQQMIARAICEAADDECMLENFTLLAGQLDRAAERLRRSRDATSRLFDGQREDGRHE